MRRLPTHLFVMAVLCGAGACVGSDPANGPGTTGGNAGDAGDAGAVLDGVGTARSLVVTPEPGKKTWTRGRSTTLPFTLQRLGGAAEDVTVTIKGLPGGSDATPAHVSATQTSGTITLKPSADAPQGDLAGATLEASATSGATASAPIDAFVRGAPGELDTTFGTAGVLSIAAQHAMGVTADGKIYVVQEDLHVRRYTADGKLDTSFGNQGTAILPIAGGGTAAKIQKVHLTATALYVLIQPASAAFQVLKSGLDGTLDASWGNVMPTTMGAYEASHYGAVVADELAVRADGTLAAMGGVAPNWSVFWISNTGKRDTGVNAEAYTTESVPGLMRSGGVFDSAGLIHASGRRLARLKVPGGGFDTAFGLTSIGYIDHAAEVTLHGVALSGSKIVVGGVTNTGAPFLARYNANAQSADTTFQFTASPTPFKPSVSTSFHLFPDGTMLLAGQDASSTRCVVLRYDASGKLDMTFGTGGISVLAPTPCSPWSVAVQPDGRILVDGSQAPGASPVVRVWN